VAPIRLRRTPSFVPQNVGAGFKPAQSMSFLRSLSLTRSGSRNPSALLICHCEESFRREGRRSNLLDPNPLAPGGRELERGNMPVRPEPVEGRTICHSCGSRNPGTRVAWSIRSNPCRGTKLCARNVGAHSRAPLAFTNAVYCVNIRARYCGRLSAETPYET